MNQATSARAPRWLIRGSDIAWRALVVGTAIVAGLAALFRLRLVVLPLLASLLLTTVLAPVADRLRRHSWPPVAAATACVAGLLALLAATLAVVGPAVVNEFDDLGPTLSAATDRLERWAIEGPLGLDRADIEQARRSAGDQLQRFVSGGGLATSATMAAEALAGLLLTIVLTFLFVKDGPRIQGWVLAHLAPSRHTLAASIGRAAWRALTGYMQAAALIGFIEAVVLGLTMAAVGAPLAAPVAAVTFVAAFFPIVGAVTAGVIAVAIAFVSGGLADAAIVGAVALAVQQLDNDLLAPVVYGRMTRVHPVVVLVALASGGTLGGITGAFLAVPLAAVGVAVGGVLWRGTHGNPDLETSSSLAPDDRTAVPSEP